MIVIKDKKKCCGCEACAQVCPRHCISLKKDPEGFFYPYIDEVLCVNCGLCEKVCPELHPFDDRLPLLVLAAINKLPNVRKDSSSGGIFTCLAERCINEGGVIFGAVFDKEWNVVISCAENKNGISAFRGSKYVQARLNDSYVLAKGYLDKGRKVLFSGTPCQINALNLFLRKDYKNLITVDFVCHGVPSPGIWRQYLEEVLLDKGRNARKGENTVSLSPNHNVSKRDVLSEDCEAKIEHISFRDKRLGWKKFSFALTLAKTSADGKKNTVSLSHIHLENPFMKAFLSNLILRPSCYDCPSKNGKSHSDITLADYWGIEKVHSEMDDDIGTSLIFVNTEKGRSFLPYSEISYLESDYYAAIRYNPSISRSSVCHPKRVFFFSHLNYRKKISDQIEKALRPNLQIRIEVMVKTFIKRIIGRV